MEIFPHILVEIFPICSLYPLNSSCLPGPHQKDNQLNSSCLPGPHQMVNQLNSSRLPGNPEVAHSQYFVSTHSQNKGAPLRFGPIIGEGGNAKVYKVVKKDQDGQELAAKFFNNPNTKEPAVMRVIAQLPGSNHFCIQMVDTISDPHGYVVGYLMPLKNRGSLESFSQKNSHDLSSLLNLSKQVLDAITFLHTHSISHGDIKEENVLLEANPDGGIKAVVSDISGVQLDTRFYLETTYPPLSLRDSKMDANGCKSETVLYAQHLDHWSYALMISRFLGFITPNYLLHDKTPRDFIIEANALANKLVCNWGKVDSLEPDMKKIVVGSINHELKANQLKEMQEIPSTGVLGMSVNVTYTRGGYALKVSSVNPGSIAEQAGVKIGDDLAQLERMVFHNPDGWETLSSYILKQSKK